MKTPISGLTFDQFCRQDLRCAGIDAEDQMQLFSELHHWESYLVEKQKRETK